MATTKLTITRQNATDYAVVTDTVLADGSLRADYCCVISAGALRSAIRPGSIRVGGLLTATLGPKAQTDLEALPVGGSITR